MINKKQRLLGIVFIILMLISFISKVFAYDVQVTKENLTEAFNAYAKGYQNAYVNEDGSFGIKMIGSSEPIQVTDTQLIDTDYEGNVYYIDYSLHPSPIFSVKTQINTETDLKTILDLEDLLKEPIVGILGVSLVQGMSIPDAYDYYDSVEDNVEDRIEVFSKYLIGYANHNGDKQLTIQNGEETKTFKQDNFDVSELVTFLFEEKKVIIDEQYEIYTYTITATQNTSNDYIIEAKLEINPDADFSKVATLNNSDTNNNDNNENNSDLNNESNHNTMLQIAIPNTGISTTAFRLIIFTFFLVIVFGIKNKRYKDIK